jgi:cytoplasmic FMR1 interacting protein
MVDRVRRFQVLNSQIFSILSKFLTNANGDANTVEHVKCFQPPIHPAVAAAQGLYLIYFLLLIFDQNSCFDRKSNHFS